MQLVTEPEADQRDCHAGHVFRVHDGRHFAGAMGHQDGAGDL